MLVEFNVEYNLDHLRVLEIGTAISVPLMGAVLRNLGAQVIKVESRYKLDGNRVRVPKRTGGEAGKMDESFPLIHEFNAGKHSVTLNLKTEPGRELFLQMIAQSDVFIQNFAPGWLDRLGLNPQRLLGVNPRLIMLYASGYGQQGPKNQTRVYAPVMTALGGLESLVGEENGEILGLLSTAAGDFNSSSYGVLALLSALFQRETTGAGCLIDLSQVEAVVSMLGEPLAEFQLAGMRPGPSGNTSRVYSPYGNYPCRGPDEWACIAVRTDAEWARLVSFIAQDDAATAERLAIPGWETAAGRVAEHARLDRIVGTWTRERDRSGLARHLQDAGVSCVPVMEPEEVDKSDFFWARSVGQQVDDPVAGSMTLTSTPAWHVDGEVPRIRRAAERLGSSNQRVFRDLLGLSAAQFTTYESEGVFD
jgi:crotonobetainyl-CoA:carnitine CoA-transferase CaiB-like acyl-CoA transferase